MQRWEFDYEHSYCALQRQFQWAVDWSTGKRRVRRCCWELWLGPEESVQVGEYGDHDHASTCGSRMYVAVVNAR